MPIREPYTQHPLSLHDLKPVPREEVEAYLERFGKAASPLTEDGEIDQMNWEAWRDLRADDYSIQWNIHEGRFRITRDEYLERWQWTVRTGRGWETLDHKVHIIDTGFIVEAILRSRHTDADGEHIILPLCETYHIQDGKAVLSNEYIDPTRLRETEADIPGGW
jgi:ketosteroid isomerase-like protein